MILAGDIGGTNTRLAFFEGRACELAELEIYASQEHESLEEMVRKFLAAHPGEIDHACFAAAGPVRNGRSVDTTNLAWPVDGASLARLLGVDSVSLLNDLEANAWGLGALGPGDFAELNEGDPAATGNVAVCSAGTGLGEAALYWDGERHHPFAGEGGHTDFAPRSELEVELWRFLKAEYNHVSYERVCSGMGLANIYCFLTSGRRMDAGDIARAALVGSDEAAVQALDLMVSIYGAEAGNLALKTMATGGVYLGGGIPPKILPKLEDGTFLRAFASKGRFQALLERIPVRVILNDRTALLGAARRAAAS
jgi:glucokinase